MTKGRRYVPKKTHTHMFLSFKFDYPSGCTCVSGCTTTNLVCLMTYQMSYFQLEKLSAGVMDMLLFPYHSNITAFAMSVHDRSRFMPSIGLGSEYTGHTCAKGGVRGGGKPPPEDRQTHTPPAPPPDRHPYVLCTPL